MKIINLKDFCEKNADKLKNKDKTLTILNSMGEEEILRYTYLMNDFIKNINELVIFKDILDDIMNEQIFFLLNEGLLKLLVEPIFKGNNHDNISDIMIKEDYDDYRKKMFEKLQAKYILNSED